ncbi:hypothetical protein HBI56_236230 [Parastagonospora nodorum]|uniref:Uncharacterized protein n=2 Tax=Phaeosphaeria nodorum (strain SN15 / ATCC MYA-4574 / FGSC 10173) TaxID=321614 RepID=A0A7U2F126_PHANO|nr:hypothetical protein SNOG_03291 [Parastagonospora nodorum SN15]KAH3903804.1 hypothetical protein HBH56_244010 [Parastagonospora nodorum]EAT90022.1 hypothetical protein SNOG_03291 [Parastagonospora nodorum SN15]KAH3937016.1 hypothetical protein HBH54_011550 [Parastagonospora nodorum]KAH3944113.1 hypothetical protein HBH53_165170 [Parastagonospora nodorum]KAH3967469.1 hypothetical protein HBH51_135000 [Parastagonospora nodorum]
MCPQQHCSSSPKPAGLPGLQSAFSEALEELEVEINLQPAQPEIMVPVPPQSPDELYFGENLPEEEFEEHEPVPTIELKIIEDERLSEYDYNCYEEEPHTKRNQNVLGLKMVYIQHDLTHGRYPTLPKYPDRIDKVFGSYEHWTALPPPGFRSRRDQFVDEGETAFCQYFHKRGQLPNLEERSRWFRAQQQDEGRKDSGNPSIY